MNIIDSVKIAKKMSQRHKRCGTFTPETGGTTQNLLGRQQTVPRGGQKNCIKFYCSQ